MTTVVLLILPLLCLCSILFWSLRNGISPTPTSARQTETVLRAIPGNLIGPIYDLGSGWGTLVIAIARHFPELKIVGIENSPIPYITSRILHLFYRQKNVTFIRADFLDCALDDAALVVCYLFPGGMRKLKPKLERLQPGTIVISNTFSIYGWTAAQTLQVHDLYRSPVYIYRIGSERQESSKSARRESNDY